MAAVTGGRPADSAFTPTATPSCTPSPTPATLPTPLSPDGLDGLFGESYYRTGNYHNYLSREGSYWKLAEEIDHLLRQTCLRGDLSDTPPTALDYGCGVGFLVRGFRCLGWSVWGYDVSTWATAYLGDLGVFSDDSVLIRQVDWVFALDVFEHIPQPDLAGILARFRARHLLVRIPVAKMNGGDMILETANADPTHVTRLTKRTWTELLSRSGWEELFRVGLYTIWDSEGVYAAVFRRKE